MSQSSGKSKRNNYDLRQLGLNNKFSFSNLIENNGLELPTLDDKRKTQFVVSQATHSAIQEIKEKYRKRDENIVLMNLAMVGHQKVLEELEGRIKKFAKHVGSNAYRYDIEQENMRVQIQHVPEAKTGRQIAFTPYENTKNFAQRIEDTVTGTNNMYMRMFLTAGITEVDFINEHAKRDVEKQFNKIKNNLTSYMDRKENEYHAKRIKEMLDEKGVEARKIQDINDLQEKIT